MKKWHVAVHMEYIKHYAYKNDENLVENLRNAIIGLLCGK